MFEYVKDNRKMNDDPGAGGGGDPINISGFVDAPPKPAGTDDPNAVKDKDTAPPSPPTSKDKDESFIEITEKSDPILRSVLSEKYEDLSLVKLNKTGDLVNNEGAVLVKKEDLDSSINSVKESRVERADSYIKSLSEVNIEGVDYKVQEDGSVKDKDGNILLSQEQLRQHVMSTDDYLKEDSDIDDEDVFAQVQSLTGLELLDEKGEPVHFDFTPEGIAQRDLHIAKQEGNRIATETISNFFSEYPELEDAFYYLKTRGTLEGIGTRTNHEGIEITEDNESQQFDIVVEGQMKRGYTKEQAKARAELYKKNDLLFEESKNELAFITSKEKEEREVDKIRFEQEQQQEVATQTKYWNNVKSKIESGKILDYNIPENIRIVTPNGLIKYHTKGDFYDYIRKPVKGNLTQAQIDAQNESIDVKIFNDFLRFTGHNMSYIVDQRVKQNKVNDLKQRFNRDAIPPKKLVVTTASSKSKDDIIF